ncbi:MAG: hypothetical protein HKN16_10865 [Saprospiraceae bacterium]|nr:hypothetical protein [Saprospiraceae bacterium]
MWRLYYLVLFLSFIISCDSEDEIPSEICNGVEVALDDCVQDNFSEGILVVNEGPFGSGSGSITMIDDALDLVPSAYRRNNCDTEIGNITQSAAIIGDKVLVVVHNANLIRVLDLSTLNELCTITGLELPRYVLPVTTNLAYVSQWGSDGVSGSVAEIELSSFSVTREVATGSGPEELVWFNDKLYVPHVGGFGRDSHLVVVNTATMSVVKKIVVGDNPQSAVVVGGDIWCLNSGFTDFGDPANSTLGSLMKIENDEVVETHVAPRGSTDLVFRFLTNTFYWRTQVSLQTMHVDGPFPQSLVFFVYYDLAYDVSRDQLVACDAKDFASQGAIVRINPEDGSKLEEIPAGLIPGEVVFY